MADAMAFWSMIVPPKGKPVQQEVESTPSVLSSIHVTGLALGPNPKPGAHVVSLEYNGTNPVLATLEAPTTRQWRLDIAIDQTFQLRNTGDSEVHVYGYQVSTAARPDDSEDESEEDDEEFDGDGLEDEDLLEGVKGLKKSLASRAKGAPKAIALRQVADMDTDEDEDEDEEDDHEDVDDEDEDEDEDEDGIPGLGELDSDDFIGEAAEEDEEEDEEGEEDEKEEVAAPVKVGTKRPAQTPQPSKPNKQLKQEPPKSAPPKQQAQKKQQQQTRPQKAVEKDKVIPVKETSKPQEVKVVKETKPDKQEAKGKPIPKEKGDQKAKQEEKAPSNKAQTDKKAKQEPTASPGNQKKGPLITPANEEEYKTAVADFVRRNGGSVFCSSIGNHIKKPDSLTAKIGVFLKKHKDTFVCEKDKVSLVEQ